LAGIAAYWPPDTELKAGQRWDQIPGEYAIQPIGKRNLLSTAKVVGTRVRPEQLPAGARDEGRTGRERSSSGGSLGTGQDRAPAERRTSMSWAQRLKRNRPITSAPLLYAKQNTEKFTKNIPRTRKNRKPFP